MNKTGFYDVRGIPICVGDLIRVKHFRHYRNRQQMWLYFRVEELSGRFVVFAWNRNDTHQCLLEHCGVESSEVLAGESYKTASGELVMWNERRRASVATR